MKKQLFFFLSAFLILIFSLPEKITAKILGGAITYQHVTGLTYNINITLYGTGYEIWNGSQDLPTLDSVHIGNNVIAVFHRYNFIDIAGSIRVSYYSEQFTFPSTGNYSIYLVTPSRIGNIANIPNSFYRLFSIKSELIISASCPNTSVNFADIPIFFAQHNRISNQNINVLNPDHDSLSFELMPCLEDNGQPMSDYSFPPGFSIDPISGEISSGGLPDSICTYALAVKITEWKNGISRGYVQHDFAITIRPDTINAYGFVPPLLPIDSGGNYFQTLNPGDSLSLEIKYFDNSTLPQMKVYGEASSVGNPIAVTIHQTFPDSAKAKLKWMPDFTHSRPYPYIYTFRGYNDTQQTDLTVLVYVNGPKPDSCYTASTIGIDELSNGNEFVLFPNPVKSEFTINYKHQRNYSEAINAIEIYNSLGSRVYSLAVHCASCIVNCESFPPGIYFVKVFSDDKIFFKKIIKE